MSTLNSGYYKIEEKIESNITNIYVLRGVYLSDEREHVNIIARLWYFGSQWFFLAFLANLFTFGVLTPVIACLIVIDFTLGFVILNNDGYNCNRLTCSPLLTIWWSLFNPNFGLYWACRYIATPFTAFSG